MFIGYFILSIAFELTVFSPPSIIKPLVDFNLPITLELTLSFSTSTIGALAIPVTAPADSASTEFLPLAINIVSALGYTLLAMTSDVSNLFAPGLSSL